MAAKVGVSTVAGGDGVAVLVAISGSLGVERGVAVGAMTVLVAVGDMLPIGVAVGTNSATTLAASVIERVSVGEALAVMIAVASGVAGRATPLAWLRGTLTVSGVVALRVMVGVSAPVGVALGRPTGMVVIVVAVTATVAVMAAVVGERVAAGARVSVAGAATGVGIAVDGGVGVFSTAGGVAVKVATLSAMATTDARVGRSGQARGP